MLGLVSLRQVPVTRVPRYVLLFTDLVKYTTPDHPDYQAVIQTKYVVRYLQIRVSWI